MVALATAPAAARAMDPYSSNDMLPSALPTPWDSLDAPSVTPTQRLKMRSRRNASSCAVGATTVSGDGTMFQAMRELWSPSWLMGHCGLWPRTVASHRGCFQAAAQVARERAQHRASSRLWATWCESAQDVDVGQVRPAWPVTAARSRLQRRTLDAIENALQAGHGA